jgi:hypothetical protein
VARTLPLARVHQLGSLDLDVAGAVDRPAHVGFEFAPDEITLRMPEHAAVRFFLQVEQVHLAAELAVIALSRFLQPVQMLV